MKAPFQPLLKPVVTVCDTMGRWFWFWCSVSVCRQRAISPGVATPRSSLFSVRVLVPEVLHGCGNMVTQAGVEFPVAELLLLLGVHWMRSHSVLPTSSFTTVCVEDGVLVAPLVIVPDALFADLFHADVPPLRSVLLAMLVGDVVSGPLFLRVWLQFIWSPGRAVERLADEVPVMFQTGGS